MEKEKVIFFLDYANINRAARENGYRLDYHDLLSHVGEEQFLSDAHCYVPINPWNEHHCDEAIEELWRSGYIITAATRNIMSPEVLGDEIDELAQRVRFKLWHALQKHQIRYPKSYIKCIVQTEIVNMLRQHKRSLSSLTDEDGEFNQGELLTIPGEGAQDPLYELEREETIVDYLAKALDDVLKLPWHQQFAMICSLKERLDNVLLSIEAFKGHPGGIGEVNWSEVKEELRRVRASLSIARKKLRIERKKKNLDLLNIKNKRRYKDKLTLSKYGNSHHSPVDPVYSTLRRRFSAGISTHTKSASFSVYDVRGSPEEASAA